MTGISWKKSVRCGAWTGCVETARLSSLIGVRDSTNPAGPALSFTRREWATFLTAAKQAS